MIVWDFEEKRLLYRMQSHDAGVAAIAFSHDDKLLLSVGVAAENRRAPHPRPVTGRTAARPARGERCRGTLDAHSRPQRMRA